MRADPNPDNRVAAALAHSPVLLIDPHRPEVLVTAELFEAQRWVSRIIQKQAIGAPGSVAEAGIK